MAENLKDFDGLITSMDCDNRYVYTMSDQTIFVWDKIDYTLTRTMDCTNEIESVRDFTVNSKRIYAIGLYNFLVLDKYNADIIYHYKFGCSKTSDFCYFFNDVEKIYLSMRNSHVIAVDKTDYMNTHILDEHTDSVTSIESDSNNVYTGSLDSTVTIWDKKSYEVIDTLKGHTGNVLVTVTDDYIISASSDRSFIIWNKDNDTYSVKYKIENAHEQSIDFITSWEHYLITMSGKDGLVKIWDINDQCKLKKEIKIPNSSKQSMMINEEVLYIVLKDHPGIEIVHLDKIIND